MKVERTAKASQIIDKCVHRYLVRCWWADYWDLFQEGWVCVLEAGNLDHLEDEHFANFVRLAVGTHLAHFLWEQSSPVTGTRGGPHLAGLQRAPISASLQGWTADPERAYLAHEGSKVVSILRSGLANRLTELYWDYPYAFSSQERIDAVLLVLLDGVLPAKAAETTGVPVYDLYKEVEWVKRYAVGDGRTRTILREIRERRDDHAVNGA